MNWSGVYVDGRCCSVYHTTGLKTGIDRIDDMRELGLANYAILPQHDNDVLD